MPFHLWARKITYDRLLDLHRRHFRRANRPGGGHAGPLVAALGTTAVGPRPSPSQEAEARELAERVSINFPGDRSMKLRIVIVVLAVGLCEFGRAAAIVSGRIVVIGAA
jgi:hypothetical protein